MAASNLRLKHGFKQKIQILIPLISVQREVDYIANIIQSSAREVCEHTGVDIEYEIGIILEVPRALLIVDHIIKNTPSIKFISIDTELLTQMTYGFGRDESNLFMVRLLWIPRYPSLLKLKCIYSQHILIRTYFTVIHLTNSTNAELECL